MEQLDLFTNEDILRATNIYNDIEKRLEKYNISEHINSLPKGSTLNQIKEHLKKHKNYEYYLKEMNTLIKKEVVGCKDIKDLFSSYIPCYYEEEGKKRLIVKYRRKGWWIQQPLYHFKDVTFELFRKS